MERRTRVLQEDGMTLVEVIIALFVLAIALFALVEGLGSGIVAVQRATKTSAAGTIADQQMEAFRGLTFDQIATTAANIDGVYDTDTRYTSASAAGQRLNTLSSCPNGQSYCIPTWFVGSGTPSNAVGINGEFYARTPDGEVFKKASGSWSDQGYALAHPFSASGGGTYRLDTYVSWQCPTGSWTVPTPPSTQYCSGARAVKQVAIVARTSTAPYKILFSETSNFDALSS